MKNLFLRSLYLILALITLSIPVTYGAQDMEGFNLSPEEQKQLDQALEEMVEKFNNLSPEQLQELEELNKQLEEEMREKGLDPSNPEDVLNWAMQEAEDALKKEDKDKSDTEQEISTKEPAKIIDFISKSEDSNATSMLLNLITYISELRQKSIAYDEMNKKLERFSSELNELSYFLHSLTNPDLMKHLMSKDFESLYKNLEAFYQTLAKQVPLIQIKEIEETGIENPYQTLGLLNLSSIEEVEDAYKNLKEMFDPEKIQEQLQKQNLPADEITKTIKQSKISYNFIQDAYNELQDPKQKAILDRKIREEIEAQKRFEKSSFEAFDEIYNVFTDKLFPILSDIKKLFEKYRPEEISKAKLYDDREKKLLAESKKPFKVIKGESKMHFSKTKDGEYEEFYKHLAQKERSQRAPSYKPLFDDDFGSDFFSGDKSSHGKPFDKSTSKGADKKDEKKPDAKKEDKEDKGDKKADEQKGSSSKDGSTKKPDDKAAELLGEIGIVSKLLENAAKAKNKVEVQRAIPTRGPSEGKEQPTLEKVALKLEDIQKGLNEYLTKDPSQLTSADLQIKDVEPLSDFLTFAKQNEIEAIATSLKKIAPKGKVEDESVSKMLKDKVLKHKKLIDTWYDTFHTILSPDLRRQRGLTPISNNKENIHRLGTKSSSKEDLAQAARWAEQAKPAFKGFVNEKIYNENLYKVREFIKGMHDSMEAIEKALGKPTAKK